MAPAAQWREALAALENMLDGRLLDAARAARVLQEAISAFNFSKRPLPHTQEPRVHTKLSKWVHF